MARCSLWMIILGHLLALVAGQVPQRQRQRVRVEREVVGSVMGEVVLRCQLTREDPEVTKITWFREINGRRAEVAVYEPGSRPWYPFEQNSGRFAFRSAAPEQDATLTIQSLTLQDGGTYFCTFIISNRKEEAQTSLIVAVEPDNSAEAVRVVESLTEMVVVAICTSTGGYPPAAITWLVEGLYFNANTTETNNTDGTITVQSQLWMTPAIQSTNKTATCVIRHRTKNVPESIPVVLSIWCRTSTDQSTVLYQRLVWAPSVSIWVCLGLLGNMALICCTIFYAVYWRSSSSKTHGVQADIRGDTELTVLSTKL